MNCEHVRFLAEAQLIQNNRQVNLVFTRSFIADQYRAVRNWSGPSHQPSSEDNHCEAAKFYPKHETVPVLTSTLPKILPQSRKYYSSVSHTLRILCNEDETTSTDDMETEEEEEETGISIPPSVNPQYLWKKPYHHDAPRAFLQLSSSNELGDNIDNVAAEMARLGLPTCFGPVKKRETATYKQPVHHTYEYSDDESDVDQRLLRISSKHQTRWKRRLGNGRRRVNSESLSEKKTSALLSRSTSTGDMAGYHRAIFANLCYFLELSYSFEQHSIDPMECQLSLAPAWFSSTFNLSAFLYHCKCYWRHKVRLEHGTSVTCAPELNMNDIKADPALAKYWAQRFRFFSRFNQGIQMDRDGFFSVTPEAIAVHQAVRIHQALVTAHPSRPVNQLKVVDACSGTGANSIQLASLGFNVTSVEIDPVRLAMSKENAKIYGVHDRITFICADFFKWALSELAAASPPAEYAAVYMSPPWGGPTYADEAVFDLNAIQMGHSFWFAIQLASQLSGGNLVLFLPRNTNMTQLFEMGACIQQTAPLSTSYHATNNLLVEVEVNVLNSKFKTITIYTGELAASFPTPCIVTKLGQLNTVASNGEDSDEEYYSDNWDTDSFHSFSSSSCDFHF